LKSGGQSEQIMKQAGVVLADLTATLEFLFDDGVENEDDVALARLGRVHDAPTTQDQMALALEDYADLADQQRAELDALGTFDVANIDLARELAKKLRQRSAPQADDDEAARAMRLRNQLWTLLLARMQRVRTVARHVFRLYPDVSQQATSRYLRRQRAEARRRAQTQTQAPAGNGG
jgi:hypothetical protein